MRLKTYRFFNMGIDHNYLDDARNRTLMQRAAAECYLPMNDLLLELIKSTGGRLRVSFYISGTALEQMRSYAPDVLRGFRKLAATGCAEFVGGTYSYSLAALAGREEFTAEVQRHAEIIREEFGQTPDAFFNTAMLYSDSIGETGSLRSATRPCWPKAPSTCSAGKVPTTSMRVPRTRNCVCCCATTA